MECWNAGILGIRAKRTNLPLNDVTTKQCNDAYGGKEWRKKFWMQ